MANTKCPTRTRARGSYRLCGKGRIARPTPAPGARPHLRSAPQPVPCSLRVTRFPVRAIRPWEPPPTGWRPTMSARCPRQSGPGDPGRSPGHLSPTVTDAFACSIPSGHGCGDHRDTLPAPAVLHRSPTGVRLGSDPACPTDDRRHRGDPQAIAQTERFLAVGMNSTTCLRSRPGMRSAPPVLGDGRLILSLSLQGGRRSSAMLDAH